MNTPDEKNDPWLPIIAKSLAFLALEKGQMLDKDLADQAKFLESLGLSRNDAAAMLGSSADSLRVMLGRAKKRKKKK